MPEKKGLKRPLIVTDAHLRYLDNLRESGVTNMWGASTYLVNAFGLSQSNAQKVLFYWMESFVLDVIPAEQESTS